MIISEEEQSYSDIDWYAVDSNGYVVTFASNCGKLPNSVSTSKEDHMRLIDYFQNLPGLGTIIVSEQLENYVKISPENRDRYLAFFKQASQKGLYCFYKTFDNSFLDFNYHLVTYPQKPLKIKDLPREIQIILERTKLNDSIKDKYAINTENVE